MGGGQEDGDLTNNIHTIKAEQMKSGAVQIVRVLCGLWTTT